MENDSQGQATDTGTSGDQGQVQVPDSLADDFLKGIPETDRNVVEPYVKAWDQGVSRKFQEIHDSYKGYKDLGSIDDLKASQEVAKMIRDDPEGFVRAAAQELGLNFAETKQLLNEVKQEQQQPVGSPSNVPAEYQGLPEAAVQKLMKMDELLNQVGQTLISQDAASKERQQMEALDNYLKELHSKHGDFDEEYVLVKMQGKDKMSGEDAVKAYQALVGNQAPRIPTPPPLHGGGFNTMPKNVKDLNSKELTDLADFIKNSRAQGS